MSDVVLMVVLTALGFALGRLQGMKADAQICASQAEAASEPAQDNGSKASPEALIPTPEPAPADASPSAIAEAWSRILSANPRAREDLALLARRHPRQGRALARAKHNMEKWNAGVDSNAQARIAHFERLMLSLRRKAQ